MRLSMAHEMQEIDRLAEADFNLPVRMLMENAGAAVAEAVQVFCHTQRARGSRSRYAQSLMRICLLVGAGNNGGDALVAARHLQSDGFKPVVVLCVSSERLAALKSACAENLTVLHKMSIPVLFASDGFADTAAEKAQIQHELALCDVIVDGLLGTGVKGKVRDPMASVIRMANSAGKPIIAIDLPSGIDSDTGQVLGVCIKATATVALGTCKPCHFLHPGAEFRGQLSVHTIGIPRQLITAHAFGKVLSGAVAGAFVPQRKPDAHKGDHGHLLVVGGSPGLSGAILLCARGALRAGAGLVTAVYPQSVASELAARPPEVMAKTLACDAQGFLVPTAANLAAAAMLLERCQVLVLGPGIGRSDAAANFVHAIIEQTEAERSPELPPEPPLPLVVDADALYALNGALCKNHQPARMILTPHPGEMAALCGVSVGEIQSDRIGWARRISGEWGVITVLKGAGTVVACPDGRYYLNPSGNSGMAVGGSGDVLAGVIGGLLAQGAGAEEAAAAGVYLHGLAGDLLAQERPRGFMAGEIADTIPTALRKVATEEDGTEF
ncbi:MAG TPA: bifunctional ADP-dependent NAD(P)H-hydrate dehydratase/NAD(P)H-hydrate epimerase [Firmicutes bacterium]|nr:bifunctional ADP-dependent NAD(P)H-hydrate dehydratase/NAD(P)H-hydrate epimerase [Bacillota bacterium]